MSAPRFLIDECLSPKLAQRLVEAGYVATSVRDRGLLGSEDADVLRYGFGDDRITVTANADDFRELVGVSELHPEADHPVSPLARRRLVAASNCSRSHQ
ncbi:MAG: DUF5615 family PIN-like protein [Deltaproteobacteria bacterium]|nr:DUF5615 family PIN-like protein [Deltaproteobacteria bacterium]